MIFLLMRKHATHFTSCLSKWRKKVLGKAAVNVDDRQLEWHQITSVSRERERPCFAWHDYVTELNAHGHWMKDV